MWPRSRIYANYCRRFKELLVMLATRLQLSKYHRKQKVRRNKVRAFLGAPMKRGFVYKVTTMSPRKPNSAKRTFAKV